jgi:hypothetical protein
VKNGLEPKPSTLRFKGRSPSACRTGPKQAYNQIDRAKNQSIDKFGAESQPESGIYQIGLSMDTLAQFLDKPRLAVCTDLVIVELDQVFGRTSAAAFGASR